MPSTLLDFPTTFPAHATQVLIDALLATTPPDNRDVFRAALTLQAYAMGQVIGQPATALTAPAAAYGPVPADKHGKAEVLKQLRAVGGNLDEDGTSFGPAVGSVGAIPWLFLLDLLYELVRDWLTTQEPIGGK